MTRSMAVLVTETTREQIELFFFFNKMFYSVLSQQEYISILATCFGFYITIFRPMLTTGRYVQCTDTHSEYVIVFPRQQWLGGRRLNVSVTHTLV